VLRDKREQSLTLTPDAKKRSSVDSNTGLEDFFGNSDGAEQTRATLAELAPMFDAMSARIHKQLEEVRTTPEATRLMARLDAMAANPDFQRQIDEARRQLNAAAAATRQRTNCTELQTEFQQKMDRMRSEMRDLMRLD
jgi:hypothetical protein